MPSETPTSPHTAQVAYLDRALWQQFAQVRESEAFYGHWITLQCSLLPHVARGVLVMGAPDTGPYAPAAFWPADQGGSSALAGIAEKVVAARSGMASKLDTPHAGPDARYGVAYPVLIDGRLHGVIAVETTVERQEQLQNTLRQLQWGVGWLEAQIRKTHGAIDAAVNERLEAALDLVAAALEHRRWNMAVKLLVTELASRLDCERVSLGVRWRGYAKVVAVSHSAQHEQYMDLIRAIGRAMDEALDQDAMVVYPPAGDAAQIVREHAALSQRYGVGGILTVPLYSYGRPTGALTLERPQGAEFDPLAVEFCCSVAALIGPILEEKRRNDRVWILKTADVVADQARLLIGPTHFVRKIAALLLIGVIAFFSVATGEYRVTAQAELEGAVQRALVAPYDGYIVDAFVRAGGSVHEGEVIAQLEDKDLRLERLKWSSQRAQFLKEQDAAMAARDRAQMNIAAAQIAQADAQLNLVEDKLARARIVAPFDGIVISGDLSHSLGASVRRGDALFEIAPRGEYRVILKVDERYIRDVIVGQQATLVLSSLPNESFPLLVERVTPVSVAEEGQNLFRVEAALERRSESLRPGMQGVGKIHVDERKLIWIWTHELVDWLSLWVWRWMP